jgi:Tfp pilus assembly PilM family ATPase
MQPQQAEEYKKTYGLTKDELEGKVRLALEAVLKLVADEIKKAIHFYVTEEKETAPSLVIVTGGTSAMPFLVSSLAEILNLEVILGNPFANFLLDQGMSKKLQDFGSLYSVAVGLALAEID